MLVEQARDAARTGDDDWLEAALKESMRLHPVIPMVVRTLTAPATIGGYDLPVGATIGPSILLAHSREENHPEPDVYRPARFLGHAPPTNTWIPFGGGVRRCIGAGFSLMEGVAVLREVFGHVDVRTLGPDAPKVRNITSVPRKWCEGKRGSALTSTPVTWADRFRAVRMDTRPLRESRDFRLLFVAGTVFYLGGMVSYVAIPFQIYDLTGSNFAVGAVALVELVPLIVFGLYGGALADHVDRRKLLIWTGVAQAAFTAILAINAFRDEPSLWVIFVVAGFLQSSSALQRPSREALMPRTVKHDQIVAGQALTSLGMQIGVLIGPAIGGLLVAYVGIGWCFVVDICALLVATVMYVAMRSYPHIAETTPPSLAGIAEGMRYALRRRDLLGTYVVDLIAMLFAMPVVLFPALAAEVFDRPELIGLLYTAETIGALVATALSGWTARVHHHGRAIVVAAAAYGLMIALAGVMPSIWLVALFLALSGRPT